MKSLYTKAPNIPKDLTKPTKSFKKHVWLAVIGLLLFIALYFTLTIWFAKLSYNLFIGSGGFSTKIIGICFAFLSFFMAKSLFIFSKREENPINRYITKEEEPLLFDYLYKLADEAGAPRPHKVFLTDRVNASVSYDLSILNLIFPSKKNLEIGLGLVNVLSLGEFKAVIAHEFGHFAQRSMLLGRYVYVGQQIARKIVNKRDAFDKLLAGISSFDIRIAWIGWIISILVWAIRALIETCFNIVAIAERALSREMEFQADLVAVSLTGSDALIHALYKLQIADEAYGNAIEVVNSELANKKAVKNLYVLQSNYIKKMSWILNKPNYGESPEIPKNNPEEHRIFTSRAYNPPQMWSTHPVDKDREENAKRRYYGAPIDGRSSWDLLSDPEAYQTEMTERLIKTAKVETTLLDDQESITIQNKAHFDWTFLHPKYHSSFLNRFAFINFKSVDDIYNEELSRGEILREFKEIDVEDFSQKLDILKEINEEIDALKIARDEVVTIEKRVIWHRGDQIKKKDIPEIVERLEKEKNAILDEVVSHDKKSRNVHYEAAKKLDLTSSEYLKKLTTLVHYSEHSISNISDCANKFNNVLAVAFADGRVTDSELSQILSISDDYYYVIKRAYNDSEEIQLDKDLLNKIKTDSYKEGFEEFKLPSPDKENLNEWIQVVGGWANVAIKNLDNLRKMSLEKLLDVEEKIQEAFVESKKLVGEFNNSITPVTDYKLLMLGDERQITTKLGFWDRFFVGDGLFPTTAKFAASGGLLLAALLIGIYSQNTNLYIYNGLGTTVTVSLNDKEYELRPHSNTKASVNYGYDYNISAETSNGELIETLQSDFKDPSKEYVYNVANSAAFVNYYVYYSATNFGGNNNASEDYLGTKKWFGTKADYKFKEPPESISVSSRNGVTRKQAIMGYSDINVNNLLSIINDKEDRKNIIRSHVLWDDIKSDNMISWVNQLGDTITDINTLKSRLKKHPKNVILVRGLMDKVDSLERAKICDDIIKQANDEPNNPDLYYLSSRCVKDEGQRDIQFISGHNKWKGHSWLAFAAAYSLAENDEWKKSYYAYVTAAQNNSALKTMITLDAERVRRMTKLERKLTNDDIDYYTELENGRLSNQPDHAYYLMAENKLDESFQYVQKEERYRPYIVRLLAASTGASKEMIEASNNLTIDEGLNYYTVWASLGLAIKQNKEIQPYVDKLVEYGVDRKRLLAFIQSVKQLNFKKADKIIEHESFSSKAFYYILASVAKEKRAPKKWRNYINSILFIDERPYLN